MTVDLIATPTTTDRPRWITPDVWYRMSWSARMRAARHAATTRATAPLIITAVASPVAASPAVDTPAPTASGAVVAREAVAEQTIAPPVEPAAPPAPAWLTAAHSNRPALRYLATVNGGHVTHPMATDRRRRRKSHAYRPVMP